MVTLACLQDLSQARVRWGEAAEGFLTLFAWKMLLPGVADLRTLQLFSALAGERWVQRQSTTVTTGGGSSGRRSCPGPGASMPNGCRRCR